MGTRPGPMRSRRGWRLPGWQQPSQREIQATERRRWTPASNRANPQCLPADQLWTPARSRTIGPTEAEATIKRPSRSLARCLVTKPDTHQPWSPPSRNKILATFRPTTPWTPAQISTSSLKIIRATPRRTSKAHAPLEQRPPRKLWIPAETKDRAQPSSINEMLQTIAQRPGSGPMSKGELYLYYERLGRLDLFFAMFPAG